MFNQVLVWGTINKWEDHLASCLSRKYQIYYQHNVRFPQVGALVKINENVLVFIEVILFTGE